MQAISYRFGRRLITASHLPTSVSRVCPHPRESALAESNCLPGRRERMSGNAESQRIEHPPPHSPRQHELSPADFHAGSIQDWAPAVSYGVASRCGQERVRASQMRQSPQIYPLRALEFRPPRSVVLNGALMNSAHAGTPLPHRQPKLLVVVKSNPHHTNEVGRVTHKPTVA